jgi:hypothetical protein
VVGHDLYAKHITIIHYKYFSYIKKIPSSVCNLIPIHKLNHMENKKEKK